MLGVLKELPYNTWLYRYQTLLGVLLLALTIGDEGNTEVWLLAYMMLVITGEVYKRYKKVTYSVGVLLTGLLYVWFSQESSLTGQQYPYLFIWVLVTLLIVMLGRSPYGLVRHTREQTQEIVEKYIRLGLSVLFYVVVVVILGSSLIALTEYLFKLTDVGRVYEYWLKFMGYFITPTVFIGLCDYGKLDTFPRLLKGLSNKVGLVFFILFTVVLVAYMIYSTASGTFISDTLIRNVMVAYLGLSWVIYYLVPGVKDRYLLMFITTLSIGVLIVYTVVPTSEGITITWYYTVGFALTTLLTRYLMQFLKVDVTLMLVTVFLVVSTLPLVGSYSVVYGYHQTRMERLSDSHEAGVLTDDQKEELIASWGQLNQINYKSTLTYTEFESTYGFSPDTHELQDGGYMYIDSRSLGSEEIDISGYTTSYQLNYGYVYEQDDKEYVKEAGDIYYKGKGISINLSEIIRGLPLDNQYTFSDLIFEGEGYKLVLQEVSTGSNYELMSLIAIVYVK